MPFGLRTVIRNKTIVGIVSLADNVKATATDSLKKCVTLLGVEPYLYQPKRPGSPGAQPSAGRGC